MGKTQKKADTGVNDVDDNPSSEKKTNMDVKRTNASVADLEAFLREKSTRHPKVAAMCGSRDSFDTHPNGIPTMGVHDGVVVYTHGSKGVILDTGDKWAVLLFGTLDDAMQMLKKADINNANLFFTTGRTMSGDERDAGEHDAGSDDARGRSG
jgi:hypothetical protein